MTAVRNESSSAAAAAAALTAEYVRANTYPTPDEYRRLWAVGRAAGPGLVDLGTAIRAEERRRGLPLTADEDAAVVAGWKQAGRD